MIETLLLSFYSNHLNISGEDPYVPAYASHGLTLVASIRPRYCTNVLIFHVQVRKRISPIDSLAVQRQETREAIFF